MTSWMSSYKGVSRNEPHREKTGFFHLRKQRFVVTAQLISTFVFRYIDSTHYNPSTSQIRNFKPLTIFSGRATRFVSDLVGNPDDRFSHDAAQINLHGEKIRP